MLVRCQKCRESPSPLRKLELDVLISSLAHYLTTPEGQETHAKLKAVVSRISVRQELTPPVLSEREERALRFIQKHLKAGHSPSVREVAKELGFRSSRSGFLVIEKLLSKGFLERDCGRCRPVAKNL